MATLNGGDKLQAAMAHIAAQVAEGGLLRVGFLEGATYPAKPPSALRAIYNARKAKGITAPVKGAASGTLNVPTVATFMEFGTGRIPPRPFFRTMIRNKSNEWGPALAHQLRATNYDVGKSLRRLGEGIAGQLRQSIVDTNSPPNAPSTIARKGHSKVLVDTGHMLASVDYEVI